MDFIFHLLWCSELLIGSGKKNYNRTNVWLVNDILWFRRNAKTGTPDFGAADVEEPAVLLADGPKIKRHALVKWVSGLQDSQLHV